jgi:hypothetical protein
MSRRGGVRVVPVLLAGALAVAACSGDDDALPSETTPAATPTVTATVEPTPTEPTDDPTPDVDPTPDLEAEITEFFEQYIEAVNESWTSEEALQRRREMFADSCEECLIGYQFAKRMHDEDLLFEGGEVEVRDVSMTSSEGNLIVFTTEMDSPSGRLTTRDGELVQQFDEYRGDQSVYQAGESEPGLWVIVKGDVL